MFRTPKERVTARLLVIFVREQDGAVSPVLIAGLESGLRAEVTLVADSGRTLAVSHLQSPQCPLLAGPNKRPPGKKVSTGSDL